jgi:hypothetical protein
VACRKEGPGSVGAQEGRTGWAAACREEGGDGWRRARRKGQGVSARSKEEPAGGSMQGGGRREAACREVEGGPPDDTGLDSRGRTEECGAGVRYTGGRK